MIKQSGPSAFCRTSPVTRRGLGLMLALSSLLSFSFDAPSAAENVKGKASPKVVGSQANPKLESILPYKFDGYTIGNPSSKNNFPGVYSAIEPAPNGEHKGKGFYTIGCSIKDQVNIPIYKKWDKGHKQEGLYEFSFSDSMLVIYFIENINKQYIYGTIVDSRALSDGVPVIVESKYWDCSLDKRL